MRWLALRDLLFSPQASCWRRPAMAVLVAKAVGESYRRRTASESVSLAAALSYQRVRGS